MHKTCGLDVHKDTVFCGVFDGKNHQEVKEYSTLTSSIITLGEYSKSEDVEDVALESTGMYWIPVWNILEEMGFRLTLVNPYLIKQMPGRKSDVKDAQWIATLLHKGLVRSSLIPCKEIRELRTYSRKYVRLQQRKTSILQEMERNLEMFGIRITSYVSNISGKSVMKIIRSVIEGEKDPEVLAGYIHGRIVNKHKRKTIVESLRGHITPQHRFQLGLSLEEYELLCRQGDRCEEEMSKLCHEHYQEKLDFVADYPGYRLAGSNDCDCRNRSRYESF